MTTIKIYDTGGNNSIEFMNEGELESGEMAMQIDHHQHKTDYLWFNISKDDAKELIKYLKYQFSLP